MSDVDEDPIQLTVLASLPAKQTNLEYLVGCWKRWSGERNKMGPANSTQDEVSRRIQAMDFVKRKIVESIGLQLQEPSLFPQPSEKPLGAIELLPPILQLHNLPTPPSLPLDTHQVLALLGDISAVYSTPASSSDLVDVLGVTLLQSVTDKLGARQSSVQAMVQAFGGSNAQETGVLDLTGMDWRNVIRAVNDLTEIKPIANMVSLSNALYRFPIEG